MRFTFPLPHIIRLKATLQPWEASVTGADQTRMVKRAEELGYDMIAVPEHFIIPNSHIELSGPHYFHSTAAQRPASPPVNAIAKTPSVNNLQ
jgi:alkanesulfonate monooxygenase SsuD/methylene tetrahydromethanopterin reductase-like flavin-dependent oxidoreductase (luciferase family)